MYQYAIHYSTPPFFSNERISAFQQPSKQWMSHWQADTISSFLHTPINAINKADLHRPYWNEDYINYEWGVQISLWVIMSPVNALDIDKKLIFLSLPRSCPTLKTIFWKLEQWQSKNQRRKKIIEIQMLTLTPHQQFPSQIVNGLHCPNSKYSSSFWLCFWSLLQPWSSIHSSINLYEKQVLLKGMNERLVITLVLSCVA